MSLLIQPSHVAVLVPSVHRAAERFKALGFTVGPAEEWEGEGTLEIYVESGMDNSVLLMEPIKPCAYERALKKRGPGLHHLAIERIGLEKIVTISPGEARISIGQSNLNIFDLI